MNSDKSNPLQTERPARKNPERGSKPALLDRHPLEWAAIGLLVLAVIGLALYSSSLRGRLIHLKSQWAGVSTRLDLLNYEMKNISDAHRYQSKLVDLQRQSMDEQLEEINSRLGTISNRKPTEHELVEQADMSRAKVFVKDDKNDTALAVLKEILDRTPTLITQYEAKMVKANALARKEDLTKAREEYRKAEGIAIMLGRTDLTSQASDGQVTLDRLRSEQLESNRSTRKHLLDQKLARDSEVIEYVRSVIDRSPPNRLPTNSFAPDDKLDVDQLFRLYTNPERMVVELDSLVETVDLRQAVFEVIETSSLDQLTNASWQTKLKDARFIIPDIKIERAVQDKRQASSGRTQEKIQEHIGLHANEIQSLYWPLKRKDSKFGGKVTMRFGISERGTIVSVTPVESNWSEVAAGKALEESMVNVMRAWKFRVGPTDKGIIYGTATYIFPT